MTWTIQLTKIGNRTVLPLSEEICCARELKDGDFVSLTVENGQMILRRDVEAIEEHDRKFKEIVETLLVERADVYRALAESERQDREKLLAQNAEKQSDC